MFVEKTLAKKFSTVVCLVPGSGSQHRGCRGVTIVFFDECPTNSTWQNKSLTMYSSSIHFLASVTLVNEFAELIACMACCMHTSGSRRNAYVQLASKLIRINVAPYALSRSYRHRNASRCVPIPVRASSLLYIHVGN